MKDRKVLSPMAMLMLTFTAIFSFNQVINNSVSIGLAAIPSFFFAMLAYFIPYSLMIAEFTSANPESESGYTSWIKSSLGPKWAFLASWTYFFVNLFFFSSLLPGMLIAASYAFTGQNLWGGNNLMLALCSIGLFWIATWITTKGARGISWVTNISGMARFAMGLIFIVLALIIVGIMKNPSAQQFTAETLTPKFNWAYFATFAWILQAVGGAESVAVYVKDLRGGNKVFIRTIIFAAVFVGLIYILGCIAVGMIIPAEILQGNYSDAIYVAFDTLGGYFGIKTGLTNIVGFILFLAAGGSVVLWASAPVKIFFSEAPKGILPGKIGEIDENGTPVKALYLQAIVVSIILIIPGLGIGQVDEFLRFLINMTAATSLLPVLFFVVAYIAFRMKKDSMPRNFRLGSPAIGISAGILLLVLFSITFVVAILPDPAHIMAVFHGEPLPEGTTHPFFSLLYQLGGVVIFLGIAAWRWKYAEKNGLIQEGAL